MLKQKNIVRVAACKVIRIPELGTLCMWNPESWALESAIQLKESRILLTIGLSNPSSIDNEFGIHSESNPESKFVLDYLT